MFSGFLQAQQEASIWYFGDHAGLDFNAGNPVTLTNSNMYAGAGCAVISDKTGQLQFYTNGNKIWNRQHGVMPNGDSLHGSQVLNQNSLIAPLPGSDDIYYLFSINVRSDTFRLNFNYSVVDMRLDDGRGDVTLKNRLLFKRTVEKLTGAQHCNGRDIWIVAHDREDGYYSFLLNADSLDETPVISHTGNNLKADIGYLKISPASDIIAMPLNNNSLLVELCRFNNRTGEIYHPVRIMARDSVVYAYGIEFSPDGNLLYITTGGKQYKLWQYDITLDGEQEINQSAQLIATGNNNALQLAPDGKMYIAKENTGYLNVINAPGEKGMDCDFSENEINLESGISLKGLPGFLPFYFYRPQVSVKGLCTGDTTFFSFPQYLNSDSLTWSFGDGTPDITTTQTGIAEHLYKNPSSYPVKLIIHHCDYADTVSRMVKIQEPPAVSLGNDTTICNFCSVTLDGGNGMDNWLWQDGSTSQYYTAEEPGLYFVTVSKNGCVNSDSVYISKSTPGVFMPNAFTPNGDGINDVLKPVTSEPLSEYHFIIFNRVGHILFESTSFDRGWDGTYKNRPQENGVYSWKIVYAVYGNKNRETVEKKGTVLLLR